MGPANCCVFSGRHLNECAGHHPHFRQITTNIYFNGHQSAVESRSFCILSLMAQAWWHITADRKRANRRKTSTVSAATHYSLIYTSTRFHLAQAKANQKDPMPPPSLSCRLSCAGSETNEARSWAWSCVQFSACIGQAAVQLLQFTWFCNWQYLPGMPKSSIRQPAHSA